jgi:RHS repeat-associated protein
MVAFAKQSDDAGNMTTLKSGDGAIYDAWNRLVEVDDGETTVARYEYDGLNRRIQKDPGETSLTVANYYYNQNWQLIEERDVGTSGPEKIDQYVWSARYIDSPIFRFHDGNGDGDMLDAVDNYRYFTTDANHNVTATIDIVTWSVVNRYSYTPYGEATEYDDDWSNPDVPAADGPLYCGYFFDSETSLYQVRNRYYDPTLERFINRDPIGYRGGDVNLYRYVDNQPVIAIDPSGLYRLVWRPGGPKFPPGQERFCKALMDKISNILQDIAQREREYQEDYLKLPETAPGDDKKPSLSRRGHRRIIDDLKDLLKEEEDVYKKRCIPPPPSCPVPALLPLPDMPPITIPAIPTIPIPELPPILVPVF